MPEFSVKLHKEARRELFMYLYAYSIIVLICCEPVPFLKYIGKDNGGVTNGLKVHTFCRAVQIEGRCEAFGWVCSPGLMSKQNTSASQKEIKRFLIAWIVSPSVGRDAKTLDIFFFFFEP